MTSLASWLSRARIQLRLPLTVLISPLCAMIRNGWASGQDGKVFVENREWTMASSVREPAVGQVREERLELAGGEHALVDEGARRQRREVDARPRCSARLRRQKAIRSRAIPTTRPRAEATNSCSNRGWHGARGRADEAGRRSGRRASRGRSGPPRRRSPRSGRRPRCSAASSSGRNAMPTAYEPRGGSSKPGDLAEERVRDLGEDAGAVTGVGLGADGTAVLEVAQRRERLLDDVVPGLAAHRRDEGDAARVVLVRAVVQPGRRGLGGEPAEGRQHSVHLVVDRAGPVAAPLARLRVCDAVTDGWVHWWCRHRARHTGSTGRDAGRREGFVARARRSAAPTRVGHPWPSWSGDTVTGAGTFA